MKCNVLRSVLLSCHTQLRLYHKWSALCLNRTCNRKCLRVALSLQLRYKTTQLRNALAGANATTIQHSTFIMQLRLQLQTHFETNAILEL